MAAQTDEEFPYEHPSLEHQIEKIVDDSDNAPHIATEKMPVVRNTLKNYDSRMRLYAARCEAGR